MSLFGLGDIQFTTIGKGSPLGALDESGYSSTALKYPLDIGATDKGHYMMIYIRKQKESQSPDIPSAVSSISGALAAVGHLGRSRIRAAGTSAISKFGRSVSNAIGKFFGNAIGQHIENADVRKFAHSQVNQIASSVGSAVTNRVQNVLGAATSMNRNLGTLFHASGGKLSSQTVQTSAVIALYMPDTLQFDFTQNYDTLSLTDYTSSPMLGKIGKILPMGIAGIALAEQIQTGGNVAAAADAAKAAISKLAGQFGGIGRAAAFIGTGGVVNPMLEVIYNAPQFRPFQFNFKFYPRTEREGVEIQKIIRLLQFHQAPELKANGSQTFLIPPSEFDIKFYYSGKENENIPKIGSCVLKSIQLNYAPTGWAAYEIPGKSAAIGGTGMPVAIEMTLMFQETIYLTKYTDGVAPARPAFYGENPESYNAVPPTSIETPSAGDIYR